MSRADAAGEMPNAGKGRLIAICGIDGSGKATQTELLAHAAEAEGWKVRQVSFPRYGEGFFADLIERYLRGEFAARAADVSPYLAALPYACDRWEAAARLRRWLGDGCLVLCNRYVPANQAHQGSKIASGEGRRAFFDWVDELEYGVFRLPRPDLHVLLDVPTALAARLLNARNSAQGKAGGHDIHERDLCHLEATARVYGELAAGAPQAWAVVACAEGESVLPREKIAREVWAKVQPVLYNER